MSSYFRVLAQVWTRTEFKAFPSLRKYGNNLEAQSIKPKQNPKYQKSKSVARHSLIFCPSSLLMVFKYSQNTKPRESVKFWNQSGKKSGKVLTFCHEITSTIEDLMMSCNILSDFLFADHKNGHYIIPQMADRCG